MKFGKKREKGTESAMWKYAKYAVVSVCVIGIGANALFAGCRNAAGFFVCGRIRHIATVNINFVYEER